MNADDLTGVLPIMPTIYDAGGSIDLDGMRAVLEYIVDAGAQGVVFPGLASEYDLLSPQERLDLTGLLGGWIAGRLRFVVGASSGDAELAIAYARRGAEAGADAAMVLTPHDLAGALTAMVGFYDRVHREGGLPVMLQNAPAPMGVGLDLPSVALIAKSAEGVRYVKEEAQPSGQRITRLTELAGESVRAVFGGAGARYVIDELSRGGKGTMPACEITELHVAMLSRFAAGDVGGARDLFERTLPLLNMQAVFRWRLTKEVLRRRGLIECTFTRAPGPELDAMDMAELDALLDRLGDLAPISPDRAWAGAAA